MFISTASCGKCESNDCLENLVTCISCKLNFHARCSSPIHCLTGKRKLTYQCHNCKSCAVCW